MWDQIYKENIVYCYTEMSFSLQLNEILIKYFPRVITIKIMDLLEYIKYSDFTKYNTHLYWTNRFKTDNLTNVYIREFFKNSLFLTTQYPADSRCIKKIIDSVDLIDMKWYINLNNILCRETADDNQSTLINILNQKPIEYYKYDDDDDDSHYRYKKFTINEEENLPIIYKIKNILENNDEKIGDQMLCNMDCVEMFVDNLTQIKKTYEEFFLVFQDYKTKKFTSKYKKIILTNILFKKIKVFDKYYEFLKDMTLYYSKYNIKARLYRDFYILNKS